MAVLINNLDIEDLIQVNANGIYVATFPEIKNALILRYKQAYGDDIDVSDTNADGIFINNTALLINSILQSYLILYNNLDVNYASASYLDALCRLTNIRRKSATKSIATLVLSSTTSVTINRDDKFVDKSGITWSYLGDSVNISANGTATINVQCDELGAIKAPAGWIYQTLEVSDITVTQSNDAIEGTERETDAELRARRNDSYGANGVTVLENMVGALLQLTGVDDILIYNNNTNTTIQYPTNPSAPKDTTEMPPHTIYVVIKAEDGYYNILTSSDPSDINTNICNTIYEKLTPGIRTVESEDTTYGTAKEGDYVASLNDTHLTVVNQKVYWKVAEPQTPTCTISIKTSQYFDYGEYENSGDVLTNGGTFMVIADAVREYLNGLKIAELPIDAEIISDATYADPKFKGARTYIVDSVTFAETVNPDTYYKYTIGNSVTVTYSTGVYTISFNS